MGWNFDSNGAVSVQIANILRLDIVTGKYKAGEWFPTVRQLAYEAGVNPNTMQKSLSTLENEGLLVNQGTNGRTVTNDISVIETTLSKMQENYVEKIIQEGINLGLTKESFIDLINKYYERKSEL